MAGVGMDLAYFVAPSDLEAAEAERRDGGPLGWPVVKGPRKVGLFRREPIVVELGAAYEGFTTRGYEPTVLLGTLESLLTGKSFEDITENSRWGGSVSNDEPDKTYGVLTVTNGLRDALAQTDEAGLSAAVSKWMTSDELIQPGWSDVPQEEHLAFARQLKELATLACRTSQQIYCYFSY